MRIGRVAHALSICGVLFLFLPLLVVIGASVGETGFIAFPPRGFSLHSYQDAFGRSEFMESLRLSLNLALTVAVLSTLLGTSAALGLRKMNTDSSRRIEAVLLAPLAIPHLVLGVAILQLIGLLQFDVSLPVLAAGHLVICLPYATRLVAASLATTDQNIDRAAEVLGAGGFFVFRYVTFPHIRPAVVASLFITATVSFDDVGVSLFLSNASTTTLPVRIFHYVEFQFAPFIAAFGGILIIVPLIAAVVVEVTFGLGRLFGLGEPASRQGA